MNTYRSMGRKDYEAARQQHRISIRDYKRRLADSGDETIRMSGWPMYPSARKSEIGLLLEKQSDRRKNIEWMLRCKKSNLAKLRAQVDHDYELYRANPNAVNEHCYCESVALLKEAKKPIEIPSLD